ncbi:MAG: metalloregulator ArsR/SmtB family transcription factor [Candidatus Cloacimonetes bacterium]|nr:metalloregulator ArsR/SmtB family transcription factor [Candidatus Cloacimonadota bacterium]
MEQHVKIFKALADKTRFRIVKMLEIKPMCVCEINEIIGFSMPAISNHLKILKEAGIITSEKDEKYVNYKLVNNNEIISGIRRMLSAIDDPQLEADSIKAAATNRECISCKGRQ